MSNVQAAVQVQEKVHSQLGLVLMRITFRVSFILTLAFAALIGIWGIACLVGGAIAAGGPVGLAQGWFSAISGF